MVHKFSRFTNLYMGHLRVKVHIHDYFNQGDGFDVCRCALFVLSFTFRSILHTWITRLLLVVKPPPENTCIDEYARQWGSYHLLDGTNYSPDKRKNLLLNFTSKCWMRQPVKDVNYSWTANSWAEQLKIRLWTVHWKQETIATIQDVQLRLEIPDKLVYI